MFRMFRLLVDSFFFLLIKLVLASFSFGKFRFFIYKYNFKLEFWFVEMIDLVFYFKIGKYK